MLVDDNLWLEVYPLSLDGDFGVELLDLILLLSLEHVLWQVVEDVEVTVHGPVIVLDHFLLLLDLGVILADIVHYHEEQLAFLVENDGVYVLSCSGRVEHELLLALHLGQAAFR